MDLTFDPRSFKSFGFFSFLDQVAAPLSVQEFFYYFFSFLTSHYTATNLPAISDNRDFSFSESWIPIGPLLAHHFLFCFIFPTSHILTGQQALDSYLRKLPLGMMLCYASSQIVAYSYDDPLPHHISSCYLH